MEKKKVSVIVAGQRFNIITEDEKYVIDTAAKIDARITSLSLSQNMSRERAAVLTALDFADDNEQDKRNMGEIKEQIKDYMAQIEKLSEENVALQQEAEKLKAEIAALKNKAQAQAAADRAEEREVEALKNQIRALKEQIELSAQAQEKPAPLPEPEPTPVPIPEPETIPAPIPVPQEAPAAESITAQDDLFFDVPQEPVVRPQKEKKNRHEHRHVNPYKQQFMKKQNEQKGYTQQRQYSLFDGDE